jgi:hypothetical protein
VVENATVVVTYTADEPVIWSLNGGADSARFGFTRRSLVFRGSAELPGSIGHR